jgi:hypothetical protein
MTRRYRVAAAACVAIMIGAINGGNGTARARDADERASTTLQCKVAVVNPVSGHAECVEPRGAVVGLPPPRPPPAKETCLRHGELGIKECGGTSPDGSVSEPATPQE